VALGAPGRGRLWGVRSHTAVRSSRTGDNAYLAQSAFGPPELIESIVCVASAGTFDETAVEFVGGRGRWRELLKACGALCHEGNARELTARLFDVAAAVRPLRQEQSFGSRVSDAALAASMHAQEVVQRCRVGFDVALRAPEDDLARFHDEHPIGDGESAVEVLLHEEDAESFLA
jgi:hypothetical protein